MFKLKELFGYEFNELAELEKTFLHVIQIKLTVIYLQQLLNEGEDCDRYDNDDDSQSDSEAEKDCSVSEAFCYIDSLKAFT